MSDLDDFTLNILQRAKARNEKIPSKSVEGKLDEILTKIKTPSRTAPEPMSIAPKVLGERNQNSPVKRSLLSDFSACGSPPRKLAPSPIKPISDEKVQIEDEEEEDEDEVEEATPPPPPPLPSSAPATPGSSKPIKVSQETRKNLKRLSQYYYGEDPANSSPTKEAQAYSPPAPPARPANQEKNITPKKGSEEVESNFSRARRSRLNALAQNINTWEEDTEHVILPGSRFNIKPVSSPKSSPYRNSPATAGGKGTPTLVRQTTTNNSPFACKPSPAKPDRALGSVLSGKCMSSDDNEPKNQLNDSVVDALEAQGFVRTLSYTKLTYDYSKPPPSQLQHTSPGSPLRTRAVKTPEKGPRLNSSANLTPVKSIQGQNQILTPQCQPQEDALTLPRSRRSVSEMTALFQDKITSHSTPIQDEKDPSEMSVAERARFFERQAREEAERAKKTPAIKPSREIIIKSALKSPGATPKSFGKSPSKVRMNLPDSSESEESFEEELRTNRNNPQSPYCLNSSQGHIPIPPPYPFLNSPAGPQTPTNKSPVKQQRQRSRSRSRSRESPKRGLSPKTKSQYPGVKDNKRIRVNDPKPGNLYPSLTDIESTETEASEAEKLDSSDSFNESQPLGINLKSFNDRSYSSQATNLSCVRREIEDMIDDVLDDTTFDRPAQPQQPVPKPPTTPLMHTLSMYRLQCKEEKGSGYTGKIKWPKFEAFKSGDESPDYKDLEQKKLEEKIEKYEQEVKVHSNSIREASKALNLCESTMEFTNSQEAIELERILLVATQKRIGLLTELQRLHNQGQLIDTSHYMILSEIAVELKRDFVDLWLKKDMVFHFITIVRCMEHLDSGPLIGVTQGCHAISGGILQFPSIFSIPNLEPDKFRVTLEIYALQTTREFIPHEDKYRIKKDKKKKGMMTPKKSGKNKNPPTPLNSYAMDAIRGTNFQLCGSMTIDKTTLKRTHWSLERVVNTSPLNGSLVIKIQYGK